jgi:hypothetical protein
MWSLQICKSYKKCAKTPRKMKIVQKRTKYLLIFILITNALGI